MDWISGLQSAIDYMEDHLTEELDYAKVAECACSSSFHFQRVFHILCGYSVGEYIRSRRLTLAGSELMASGVRVLDVALKYGYDSPESFARAFARFHGILPSRAKEGGAPLRSFSRLSVRLILEGGTTVDYRIETKKAIKMAVRREHFPGGETSYQQVSAMWKRCMQDGTIDALCSCSAPDNVFGGAVCGISYSNCAEGGFDYAIGTACDRDGLADERITVEEIPACTWAIFKCVGPMPEAFTRTWKQIYSEFFPTSEYQPAPGLCIEVYPKPYTGQEDYSCEIWLTVEKK